MRILPAFLKYLRRLAGPSLAETHPAGDLADPDFEEIELLASSGNALAMFTISEILDAKSGSNEDTRRADALLRSAASADYPPALFKSAGRHLQGTHGCAKDGAKALAMLSRAATQGHTLAQANLGMIYLSGEITPLDYTAAARWLKKASDGGDAVAQCAYATLCLSGNGVDADSLAASRWFVKSAEQGNSLACFNLGSMFAEGQGVEISEENSLFWFSEAADLGDPVAQYNLGILHLKGQGVPIDRSEALSWFLKSAAGGYLAAQFAACEILSSDTIVQINDSPVISDSLMSMPTKG